MGDIVILLFAKLLKTGSLMTGSTLSKEIMSVSVILMPDFFYIIMLSYCY